MGVTKTQGIADMCEHILSENSELTGDVLMDKHMTHSSPCDMCPCDKAKIIIKTTITQFTASVQMFAIGVFSTMTGPAAFHMLSMMFNG